MKFWFILDEKHMFTWASAYIFGQLVHVGGKKDKWKEETLLVSVRVCVQSLE